MQDESQASDKKFEIFEERHRQRPKQKIYKIRIYLISNMLKAEEKLRHRYERQPNEDTPGGNQQRASGSLEDDIFEQIGQEEALLANHQQNGASRGSSTQQKPIRIYEDFKNRGKHENLKFHFSRLKQRITIIISQRYFISELKLKQFDLLMVYQSFTKIWQQQYLQIMQTFIKYSKQFKSHDNIKFEFMAIDILGVTFQIAYSNKVGEKIVELKRFRFRYSAFQFRQNPLCSFQEKNTEQIISFVEVSASNSSTLPYNDFYTNMRLSFIDDINNNSSDLWRRMIMRFWVFYQLHCLNRGMGDYEDFNRRALGRVHFNPIRMKKFQLIYPFPLLHKNIIDEGKQAMAYFTFYLDEKQATVGEGGLEFKINVNIVEHYNILTFQHKKQILARLSKQDSFSLIEKPNLAQNQLFEFWMVLKFDEKISKAFSRFETVVSFFIDRVAFYDVRERQQEGEGTERVIEIVRELEAYDEGKNEQHGQKAGQFVHHHTLVMELRHRHSVLTTYPNTNMPRYVDETTFIKLYKKKLKYNSKQKNQQAMQKAELVINDELKRYINMMLKIKPLRECYKQVMDYVQKVVRIIHTPFRDLNTVQRIQNRQVVLSLIITNICRLLELGNHHSRKFEIMILHDKDTLLMRGQNQEDLVAEITFNIKDLKIYWIKRLPEGYIIVRMFEKHIEIVKDLNLRIAIDVKYAAIEQTSDELMKQLRNILMKEFATLQNMMI